MGENNVKEIKCESVKDFIQRISYGGDLYYLIDSRYIYRGESSDKYELIPSALRPGNHEDFSNLVSEISSSLKNENSEYAQIITEYIYLHLFYTFCDYRGLHVPNINDFRNKLLGTVRIDSPLSKHSTWLPSEYIEIAGLAQHYGVKTRLLDWSRDINIAIYFAITGLMKFEEAKIFKNIEMPEKIVLWVLDTSPIKMQEKESSNIILYTPQYAGNPNLCAQKGVFSLYSVNCHFTDKIVKSFEENDNEVKLFMSEDKIVKPFDEIIKEQINSNDKEPILYKILIPTPQDDELYNYLSNNGYDASLIFPGYEGAAKTIKESIYWKNLKQKNEQESKRANKVIKHILGSPTN